MTKKDLWRAEDEYYEYICKNGYKNVTARTFWAHTPMSMDEMTAMCKWFDENGERLGVPIEYVTYIVCCNGICFDEGGVSDE